MSDDNKPTLGRKPLGLKLSVQAGQVQQTFSHGRTNKVVVEVKRRKLIGKPGEAPVAAPAPPPPPPAPVAEAPRAPAPRPPAASSETRQELQSRLLREAEEARMNANELASRREQEHRAAANAPPAAPVAVAAPAPAPVAAPVATEVVVEAAALAEVPATESSDEAPRGAAAPAARRFTPIAAPKRPEPAKKPAHPRDKTPEQRRHAGKLTVSKALNEDEGARARSLAALKRAREKEKRAHFAGKSQPREKQARDVIVPEEISVQELATAWPKRAVT